MKDHTLAEALGIVFRSARLERGYSQEQLAARTGIHRASLAAVERGERAITVESAQRIASALEMQLSEVFKRLEVTAAF